MQIFKKNSKSSSTTKDNIQKKKSDKNRKKTKIGFGRKQKKEIQEAKHSERKKVNKKHKQSKEKSVNHSSDNSLPSTSDTFMDELSSIKDDLHQTPTEQDQKKEREWTSAKRKKRIIPKNLKGKPIFLEDTGEKLGIIFDLIYDGEQNLLAYKIKDDKTDAVLSFSIDQFDEGKNGLIFIPSWYTKSLKTLEKLEFKERVSPELTTLLSDDAISNEELYNIFVKHDDQMAQYIEEAVALKELINQRLNVLEKQRLALKDDLMDLTEQRLIKDLDRRSFSENVMEHRRKVNVLDVNISKCKELLQRLNKTSFGMLGAHILSNISVENKKLLKKEPVRFTEEKEQYNNKENEEMYKEKYYEMKERFEHLQNDYEELKIAVSKLITKNEFE
jgi:hypothetical protein